MNLEITKTIRLYELHSAFSLLKKLGIKNGALLEIGAGAGWQAQELSKNGFHVSAIDIKTSRYISNSVWHVEEYDGYNIPFPDNHFDVVFSSSVLEHIPHIEKYQAEIARVLKKKGTALHIVPSTSWRLWTNIMHYIYIPKLAFSILFSKFDMFLTKNNTGTESNKNTPLNTHSLADVIRKTLLPSRHGELGNSLTELYYFSRFRWNNLFTRNGWKIKKHAFNNLTYTGYLVFGLQLTINFRKHISRCLGSVCHIYIVEKK